MALTSLVAPIQESRLDEWDAFTTEMLGPRRTEYEASRKRLHIKKERVLVQRDPDGPKIIYAMTTARNRIAEIYPGLAASEDPFDVWYKERMKSLLGIEFRPEFQTEEPVTLSLRLPTPPVRVPRPA
jgi:hypothetical protein